MLDKLKLNKNGSLKFFLNFALVLAPLIFNSCYHRRPQLYNTEVICPSGFRVLVKFANLADMKAAIEFALEDKKKYGTSENYTVIRLPKNRSFKLDKLPPEQAIKCALRSFPVKATARDYRVYFPDD
jgi:hypothetical protein